MGPGLRRDDRFLSSRSKCIVFYPHCHIGNSEKATRRGGLPPPKVRGGRASSVRCEIAIVRKGEPSNCFAVLHARKQFNGLSCPEPGISRAFQSRRNARASSPHPGGKG